MKTITTESSKANGAFLVIGESPWFAVAIDSLVSRYNPHWGFDYRLWNAVLIWCDRRDRELFRVPVNHSCEVAEKIWGADAGDCYHEASSVPPVQERDDDFRSVLVPDPTGPGMYRIVEEYVGDLPPVEPGPPLRRATRKPTRGRPATQTDKATSDRSS